MRDFFFENFWRLLTNLWTLLFILLIVGDFLYPGRYEQLLTPFALLYGAVLSIFVGTKEFARWHIDRKDERHPGEMYVVLWSVVVFGISIAAAVMQKPYRISADVISSYIMILTVFALTQASKRAHRKRAKKLKK